MKNKFLLAELEPKSPRLSTKWIPVTKKNTFHKGTFELDLEIKCHGHNYFVLN